jgi:alkylhydroperoxidase family enzyme
LEAILFQHHLTIFREKIRLSQYLVSIHADEEMRDDDLSIYDIENCILTGQITERQKSELSGEWKYVIRGHSFDGDAVFVVVKERPIGKILIITVFREVKKL